MHPNRAALIEAIGEICELADSKTNNPEQLRAILDGIRQVISDLYAKVENAHNSR